MAALTRCRVVGVEDAARALRDLGPDGVVVLADSWRVAPQLPDTAEIHLVAACPCCAGQLPFRTQLHRVLRRHPAALLIVVSADAHRLALTTTLGQPPYDQWLTLVA